ncbi:MAG: hypothetical protein H7A52_11425 [Akkermansiaceae bacterium]|nr:hypothetical protein [Akkermansiaceae bacterium]
MKRIAKVTFVIFGVFILTLVVWFFAFNTDGIAKGDSIIEKLEEFRSRNGSYPETLADLSIRPNALSAISGMRYDYERPDEEQFYLRIYNYWSEKPSFFFASRGDGWDFVGD